MLHENNSGATKRKLLISEQHGAFAVRCCPSDLIMKELLLKLPFSGCNIPVFTDTADELKLRYVPGIIQIFPIKHWKDGLKWVAERLLLYVDSEWREILFKYAIKCSSNSTVLLDAKKNPKQNRLRMCRTWTSHPPLP